MNLKILLTGNIDKNVVTLHFSQKNIVKIPKFFCTPDCTYNFILLRPFNSQNLK